MSPDPLSLVPAKELPQNTPDVRGVVVRRQDKSLFVGTGRLTRMSDEAPTTYDGPVLEVVVTHDTQIFCDDTARSAPDLQADKIQQVVKPCSLDDIAPNIAIQVWGEKTGDRTVARILVSQAGGGIPGAGGKAGADAAGLRGQSRPRPMRARVSGLAVL